MAEGLRYLGASEFVDQLSEELLSASLQPQYADEAQLRADVAQVMRQFIERSLAPLGLRYQIQECGDAVLPVPIFGTDFYPDMAIEVTEFPAVAFTIKLIRGEENPELKISSAIGQAVIYSRYYPSVIAFILNLGSGKPHKHWSDWELKADLWRKHKIKLVIRQ